MEVGMCIFLVEFSYYCVGVIVYRNRSNGVAGVEITCSWGGWKVLIVFIIIKFFKLKLYFARNEIKTQYIWMYVCPMLLIFCKVEWKYIKTVVAQHGTLQFWNYSTFKSRPHIQNTYKSNRLWIIVMSICKNIK